MDIESWGIGTEREIDKIRAEFSPSYIVGNPIPAFSLEDILRKDNAEKIWGRVNITMPGGKTEEKWWWETRGILEEFQDNPDTWPDEVARLINPNT